MCLKLKITLLNCFFQDICLVFLFLINFDNSSPISDAFDPFLHFDEANECKSTYLAKSSVVISLPKVKSMAELPATTPDKRSPNPAGLGDLLSGVVAGSSAIDLTFGRDITTELFAKYVLLHSFASSKCKKGSNASEIGDELSKLMRNRKTRQIS